MNIVMVVTHLLRRSFAEASQGAEVWLLRSETSGPCEAASPRRSPRLAAEGSLWMKLDEIVAQTVLCLTSLGSL